MADIDRRYRDYLSALNGRRLDRLAEFVHDPVVFNDEPVALADYRSSIAGNIDAVPDFHWQIDQLLVDGDDVAVRLTDTGTPTARWLGLAPTGKSVRASEFAFYHYRDGKIDQMWFLLDRSEITRQIERP